ncbi:cytochrome c biogenesis CcdA family protein [Nakamurella endophytica]|uniref:Cytochrome c biogenesis protein n=1 Tax=Nakamurella endophytica TaxID=1748367 RepID=A0A917WP58_9ACTN|nr:cytochrome c biogenesis CcdA family protein [Nakamurella endophytica]GGM18600.1 cytochrome c biogenesis protein [Nakamurella endophytica]
MIPGIASVHVSASGITDTVLSGPFVLAAMLAFAAGAVSFASPCSIPLVPGYLAYLIGLVGAESAASTPSATIRVRARAVRATALFVAGFTAIFLAQTVAVLSVAWALLVNNDVLMRIGGVVTVVMGLALLGFIPVLQREKRVHLRPTGRNFGPLLLGGAYGLGWVVCIGPTLAGVIALATATDWGGSAWRGLLLVLFYCAGLGVPFLLLAFGFGWASSGLAALRRRSRSIQRFGGVAMIALGILMVSGVWGQFIAWLQVAVSGSGGVWL